MQGLGAASQPHLGDGVDRVIEETWGGGLMQLKTIAGGHDEFDLR